ncbi:MAG: DUF1289 domain-containing protein [Gammaproteobacteria bacterium]|nr:DUF1289 domain-containing protein [Gammaproteobacteria bacterium]
MDPERVASPCVRNCCLDEQDICLGCGRSLAEITAWGGSSDHQRRAILERAARRRYAEGTDHVFQTLGQKPLIR